MTFAMDYTQLPEDKNLGTTILVVDDEPIGQKVLAAACDDVRQSHQLNVLVVASLDEAFQVLRRQPVHVLLLDKNLGPVSSNNPQHDGIAAIPEILSLQPQIQILMVTASDDVQDTVQAIKYGAYGYVCKGRADTRSLMICQIEKAIGIAHLTLDRLHAERGQKKPSRVDIGCKSTAMRQVINQIRVFSETSRPILLTGPSGVGKTTLAQLAHEYRQKFLNEESRPFVQINIAAIPANLVESELFGHEKGAFTDAKDRKIGLIELANRGTLFLDEIGDASADMQVKLLKVLDEKRLRRVGGKTEIDVNFKLICATHRNLQKLVEEGRFREDLYMRISTFMTDIPALSERKEDIPDIIRAALPRWCEDINVQVSFDDLPQDLIEYLVETSFPGNVRGIEQQISRVLVLSDRDINGRPILKNWRSKLRGASRNASRGDRTAITLKDLMTLPLDVAGDEFPGMTEFMEALSEKVWKDAKAKHRTNNAIARALKLSNGYTSIMLRRLQSKEVVS